VESETNDYTTNLYIGVTPRLSHPQQYQVEQPRNHGGERQLCPHCHSDRLQRKVTITCMHCGSVLDEKISLVNQGSHFDDSSDENTYDSAETQDSERNVNLTTTRTNDLESQLDISGETVCQEPATPPVSDVGHAETGELVDSNDNQRVVHEQNDNHPQVQRSTQADVLAAAARLLVDMAGPEPVHIEMSPRGPKKYYDVHRPLTERDTRAHLQGWKTTGACLHHPDGMTRALCYDADTPEDWQHLVEAAQLLPYGDYLPLLEPSPVQASEHTGGGHLWIIFDGLVKASWAKQHVMQFAPSLRHIKESWPGPGNHKVRLPGGKYVKPGFAAWCTLTDGEGNILATDGLSAARVLLASQTPATHVPAYPASEAVGPCPGPACSPNDDHQVQAEQEQSLMQIAPGVDARWQQQYGRFLWFQFTPAQLAAWYNERHKVPAILPPEKNGMGLASWRGEHTASVGLREDGWVDFGASVRRADGKQDGGDALELTVRVNDEPKSEVMRELARQLVSEARGAVESAAQCGEHPPPWVQALMSPAGWERYHQLLEEAGHGNQAITASAVSIGGVAGSCTKSPAQAVPAGSNETHDTPEVLAAELGAIIDEPCKKCGCTLYYQSGPYQMCYWCLPRPAKYGLLSAEQHARLRAVVKAKCFQARLAG
jgi:transcription initiation factor TFIIIB Brf1 subunit/transcription initiation factor TFIIB